MISQSPNRVEPDLRAVEAAVKRATAEIALTHARAGHAVPVARDGGVVWISPEEMLADLEATEVYAATASKN